MERIYIGTSGWVYKGWSGAFYPKELRQADHFGYYAQHFPTVEINATFYRLPTENMVKGWHDKAPDDFIFAVKGSRFITQMKKLNVTSDSISIFFERITPLREHLGPILWQLPPSLHKDVPRLDRFLAIVPKRFRHAVEFRHPSWMADEVFEVLRAHDAAHVSLSSQRMPMDFTTTTAVEADPGIGSRAVGRSIAKWRCAPARRSTPTSTTIGIAARRKTRAR